MNHKNTTSYSTWANNDLPNSSRSIQQRSRRHAPHGPTQHRSLKLNVKVGQHHLDHLLLDGIIALLPTCCCCLTDTTFGIIVHLTNLSVTSLATNTTPVPRSLNSCPLSIPASIRTSAALTVALCVYRNIVPNSCRKRDSVSGVRKSGEEGSVEEAVGKKDISEMCHELNSWESGGM